MENVPSAIHDPVEGKQWSAAVVKEHTLCKVAIPNKLHRYNDAKILPVRGQTHNIQGCSCCVVTNKLEFHT